MVLLCLTILTTLFVRLRIARASFTEGGVLIPPEAVAASLSYLLLHDVPLKR